MFSPGLIASCAALTFLSSVARAELTIGDPAPPLKVQAYVRGNPVDLSRGTHVVEFWGTWCTTCVSSMPHLTELAKKYRGKVDVTGVSVWEKGDNPLAGVRKYVADSAQVMQYNVAYDGPSNTMANRWLAAAKMFGVPTAYLVKDGKILWIGHPLGGLDKAVEQALAGTLDVAASRAAFERVANAEADLLNAEREWQKDSKPIALAMKRNDKAGALKAMDDLMARKPALRPRIMDLEFTLLMKTRDPKAIDIARELAEGAYNDDPGGLNFLALSLLDQTARLAGPELRLALDYSRRAAALSNMADPVYLDTYAAALYASGQKAKAIQIESQAVELGKSSGLDPILCKNFSLRLKKFKSGK